MTVTNNNGAPMTESSDGLALPVDFAARYGNGHDRALVLGGGGVFFVAWQTAYLTGLMKRGVRLTDSDIVVGTSAGSIIASVLTRGRLGTFSRGIDVITKIPGLASRVAPTEEFDDSQLRALDAFRNATTPDPAVVKEIGHAALAANTASPTDVRRRLFLSVGPGWPSDKLHISATDAYTGERVVLTRDAKISAVHAAAASSAVPGIFPPQPVGQRRLMDGGCSGTGTHSDIVAGAQRAFIVSLSANVPHEVAMMTIPVGTLKREQEELEKAGTAVEVRGPHEFDITKLMDPDAVPEARAMGDAQAEEDAAELATFWN